MPKGSTWTKKGRALREERKCNRRLVNLLNQLDDLEDSASSEAMPRHFDSVVHHIADMRHESSDRIRALMGQRPVLAPPVRSPHYRQIQKRIRKTQRRLAQRIR